MIEPFHFTPTGICKDCGALVEWEHRPQHVRFHERLDALVGQVNVEGTS